MDSPENNGPQGLKPVFFLTYSGDGVPFPKPLLIATRLKPCPSRNIYTAVSSLVVRLGRLRGEQGAGE